MSSTDSRPTNIVEAANAKQSSRDQTFGKQTPTESLRVAYLLSHPIQYQSPLLRRLAQEPGLDMTVFYTSDFSLRSYRDQGFGRQVEWDISLVGGYRHEILPRWLDGSDIGFLRPLNHGVFSRLRRGKFDVLWIHGYATLNAWMAMAAARWLGIPALLRTDSTLIDHPRSTAKLALKRTFFRLLRPFVYGVLSVGQRNSEYWRHSLGPDIPLFEVPYAVDNAFFRQRCQAASATREELRQDLKLKPGRPVILFAAKLLGRKRCIDLVEAYLEICSGRAAGNDDGPLPYLVIVGDGEEHARIKARIDAAGDAGSGVRMIGFQNQSELPRYYDLCDVFVLPSVYEPWGLAVNEAMNAGRAIIVSDEVGCQPDLVVDGENGCVFPARDVPALAVSLNRVLSNPETSCRMGECSLKRVESFSFDADAESLMRAFTQAARHRRGWRE